MCIRDRSNNDNNCTGTNQALVAGNISTMEGTMLEGANVEIIGQGNMPSAVTGENGTFSFSLNKGQTYEVQAKKEDNHLNGVSTFDLIVISKHILGITEFMNPYQYIAADINQSGTISAFDLVQLRQLILNITTEFPNNEAWRFVATHYEFNTENPLAENYSEVIKINDHQADMMDADFVAIKIGDLNHSARVNQLQSSESRTILPTTTLTVTDRHLAVGEVITVDFNFDEIDELQGYQMALNYAGLELVNIEEGLVEQHHFGSNLQEESILLNSWDRFDGSKTTTEDQPALFSLKFKALKAGKLSEFLHLQSTVLQTEAYTFNGALMDIVLQFETAKTTAFTLEQNHPNPFRNTTSIGFQLPEAGWAILTILDVQGQVLLQERKDFSQGAHQWIIEGQSLNSRGILYYQLATDKEVLTRKMMRIE